ncbi:TetR family transcriptional regulator [Nocardiopsis gilva YIM 90087]|uniref:TetR family transcriptional regulator n=1 Tax=Nocardiopsis gilva YIM 90087 TaxID=1235441 RepID=A0A223S5D5_9ACTN|nr:TetR/AcrR family transcriptional regulator [Nocardiopsis gilva]ASU83333.1 TetR family transcriptional regulator [Nocardiopsis gilva YIM 90087]
MSAVSNDAATGTPEEPVMDHRKLPRRRGAALNAAILRAALDELTEVGYARFTMEGVAERAQASKASLYRRWPGRAELVLDAAHHALSTYATPPNTGSLRGDFVTVLTETSRVLAGPMGEALRGLLGDMLASPGRMAEVREYSGGRTMRMMYDVVSQAVDRDEVDPAALTERRLEAGLALLRYHFLFNGAPIPDEVVTGIVDDVMMPLFPPPPGK